MKNITTFIISFFCVSVFSVAYAMNENAALSIVHAEYASETSIYPHHVMGKDVPERMKLVVYDGSAQAYEVTLPTGKNARVFEDLFPRIADVDGDSHNDVVVVESNIDSGASIAVYSIKNQRLVKIAQNDFLGKKFTWLALVGIEDFDGDGQKEIAYIEKPHAVRVLQFWKFSDGALIKVNEYKDVTSHVLGTNFYQSAIQSCAGHSPRVVLVDPKWQRLLSIGFSNGQLIKKDLGKYMGPDSAQQAAGKCEEIHVR